MWKAKMSILGALVQSLSLDGVFASNTLGVLFLVLLHFSQ